MSCVQDFPYTSVLYPELQDETSNWVVTAICAGLTVVTLIIFLEEVRFFIHADTDKKQKPKVLCLVALYPIIAANALLSVLIPRASLIAEFLSSLYLAFCILLFVKLVIAYFGGTDGMLQAYEGDTISFRRPPCCCCFFCLSDVQLTRKTLKIIQIMVLQLSIVRPGILYIIAILHNDGRYYLDQTSDPSEYGFWLKILSAISTMFAVYGLIVTFFAARTKVTNPRFSLKAASLKIAVMVFDIQHTVVILLARTGAIGCVDSSGSYPRAARIHNYLLIFEMFLLSIMARFAFRFEEPNQTKPQNGDIDLKTHSLNQQQI